MTLKLEITFHDYWHTGSGLTGGTYADQLVNKTRDGFPVVPGKTIKGLLRHAAQDLHQLDSERISDTFIKEIFGESPSEQKEKKQEKTIVGSCFFTNAELDPATRTAINETQKPALYEVLASTKINEQGTAEDGSLRQMEVTIPLTLSACIHGFPKEGAYLQMMYDCAAFIKRLGQNRHRGLGRCTFKISHK